jgi:hypothetical protein
MVFYLGPTFVTVSSAGAVCMKSHSQFGAERQLSGSLIISAASDYAS